MTAHYTGTALLLLAGFIYVARSVLAYTPVRPSANATLAMCMCAALGLSLFIVEGIL
jgi:hypothetical protein